jgi:hypothetical protein
MSRVSLLSTRERGEHPFYILRAPAKIQYYLTLRSILSAPALKIASEQEGFRAANDPDPCSNTAVVVVPSKPEWTDSQDL